MESKRSRILWQVIPVLLVAVLVIAGGTDIFTATVRRLVDKLAQDFVQGVLPFAVNCLIGLAIICLAKWLYAPLMKGVHKLLDSSRANDGSKAFMKRALQTVYWFFVGFLVVSIVAPQVLGKIAANLVLFGAAVVVALQDLAKDAAGGFILLFMPVQQKKCEVGDRIQLVGLESVSGKVVDIDILTTKVETSNGMVIVPNREFLARSVLRLDQNGSPPGTKQQS